MAVAATVIHYINDVLADMAATSESEGTFSLEDYAKHWGEAKGFGLWFQFNPHSPLIDEEFAQLHELLGQSGPGWDATGSADTPEAMTFMNDLVAALRDPLPRCLRIRGGQLRQLVAIRCGSMSPPCNQTEFRCCAPATGAH